VSKPEGNGQRFKPRIRQKNDMKKELKKHTVCGYEIDCCNVG